MVLNISDKEEILSSYFYPTSEIIPEAGFVKEDEGFLYIGGYNVPYSAKYKLKK